MKDTERKQGDEHTKEQECKEAFEIEPIPNHIKEKIDNGVEDGEYYEWMANGDLYTDNKRWNNAKDVFNYNIDRLNYLLSDGYKKSFLYPGDEEAKKEQQKIRENLDEYWPLMTYINGINNGNIKNLSDIDWLEVIGEMDEEQRGYLKKWSTYYIEFFVRSIENPILKVRVLDCIIEQYKTDYYYQHQDDDEIKPVEGTGFIRYCNVFKTHIEHYEAYNVEAVLKANAALEKRVSNLESAVYRHFNCTLTDEQLKSVLQALTSSRYLAADTDFAAWVWVCTGRGEKVPTEPLKWLSQQNLLACAVDKLFGYSNAGDLWEVAAACFLVKSKAGEWKRPNVSAMKNTKGKTNGEKKTKLLNLLETAT